MNALVIPILWPLFTAILLALVNGRYKLEKALSVLSTCGLAGWVFWLLWYVDQTDAGVVTMIVGGWEAPFGIAMVADRLAAIMLCLSMGVGAVVNAYTCWTVTDKQQKYFFYPLFQVMLCGVNWAFISGDIFNLFVAYEVMLIGSYGMMIVGASRSQIRQTLNYIAINVVGSTFFVGGVAVVYATTGHTNMAAIAQYTMTLAEGSPQAAMVTAGSMLLLTVFAMKTAAWPLFFWLPDSYPSVPAGVIGFFAGLLTKVGVYSLLRVFGMIFQQPGHELALDILLVLSGFTMLLGVLGAMCQWEIRKILSWHIISQVGYMVMGIGLCGSAHPAIVTMAVVGTIFYIVHHIIVKSCLFLVGGIAGRVAGTQELKKMGGVLDLAPGVAGLFLIAALSLAGMPPFSGFWSKFVLIRAGLHGEHFIIVTVAIVTGFFTLYSMTKIWSYGFWGKPKRERAAASYRGMMIPTAVLVVFTVFMGVFAQPFYRLATDAATIVKHPQQYIAAVLGEEALVGLPADTFDEALNETLDETADATAEPVAITVASTNQFDAFKSQSVRNAHDPRNVQVTDTKIAASDSGHTPETATNASAVPDAMPTQITHVDATPHAPAEVTH